MARDFHLSVSADFIGHVKTRKLVRLLGGDESAPLRLIQFWSWAAEFAPTGDLSEIDVPEIEYGAGHKGTEGQMFKALVTAGFIDETPGGPRIHNWMLPGRTGFAIEAMEKSRARWRRSKGIRLKQDEEVTEDSARNPAGVSEDSSGLHGSRFTVHGSQEKTEPEPDRSASPPAAIAYPAAFEEVWEKTGKNGSKFPALKAWKKAQSPPWSAISVAWRQYMASADPVRGFVKHLSSWLNDKGHLQEWPPAGARARNGPAQPTGNERAQRNLAAAEAWAAGGNGNGSD